MSVLRPAASEALLVTALLVGTIGLLVLSSCSRENTVESVQVTPAARVSTEVPSIPVDAPTRVRATPVVEDETLPPVELDRVALVALYNAADGLNWATTTNWLSNQPIDTWYGVTSDRGGLVTHLELQGNGLRGQIPPELGSLGNLLVLDLSWNRLSGQIPPELGNLRNMRRFLLQSNRLSEQIPPELGSLDDLLVLDRSWNGLGGEIPPELGSLDNLRRLYLEGNQLSGEIPPELGNNLTVLHLYGNLLSGHVPPELGNLDNLTALHLFGNLLSGQVPQDLLSGMENLTWLSLDGNRLTGCLPSALRDKVAAPYDTMRGLPFCDEVPPPRPCTSGMVLKPGEYCTMVTRPRDSWEHPAWPYQLEVRQEGFACLGRVCGVQQLSKEGFRASQNADESWTIHMVPVGNAPPPVTPTPWLSSNFGGLSMGPNDNSIVNIYMVNPSQEQAEAMARQQLQSFVWPNIREVRTFKVKYSKIQLDSWSRILTGYMGGPEFPEVQGGGVAVLQNRVSLSVLRDEEPERVEASIRERMVLHNIPQDAVIFERRGPTILR